MAVAAILALELVANNTPPTELWRLQPSPLDFNVTASEWPFYLPEKNFSLRLTMADTETDPSVATARGYAVLQGLPTEGMVEVKPSSSFSSAFDREPDMLDSTLGALGPTISSSSQTLSLLANALQKPLVSPSSTAAALSSQPFFCRTVPPDNQQSLALVNICLEQGWNEIAFISTNDAYGAGLAADLMRFGFEAGITVTGSSVDPKDASPAPRGTGGSQIRTALESIRESDIRVVALLCTGTDCLSYLHMAVEMRMTHPFFPRIFLAVDGWVSKSLFDKTATTQDLFNDTELVALRRAVDGSLGTRPLLDKQSPLARWFQAALDAHDERLYTKLLNTTVDLLPEHVLNGSDADVTFRILTLDAVWLYANAIHSVLSESPTLTGSSVYNAIKSIGAAGTARSVTGPVLLNGTTCDRILPQEIVNIRFSESSDQLEFVSVGWWNPTATSCDSEFAPAPHLGFGCALFTEEIWWPGGGTRPVDALPDPRPPLRSSNDLDAWVIILVAVIAALFFACFVGMCFFHSRRVDRLTVEFQSLARTLSMRLDNSIKENSGKENGSAGHRRRRSTNARDIDGLLTTPLERILHDLVSLRAEMSSTSKLPWCGVPSDMYLTLDDIIEEMCSMPLQDIAQPGALRDGLFSSSRTGSSRELSWLRHQVLPPGGRAFSSRVDESVAHSPSLVVSPNNAPPSRTGTLVELRQVRSAHRTQSDPAMAPPRIPSPGADAAASESQHQDDEVMNEEDDENVRSKHPLAPSSALLAELEADADSVTSTSTVGLRRRQMLNLHSSLGRLLHWSFDIHLAQAELLADLGHAEGPAVPPDDGTFREVGVLPAVGYSLFMYFDLPSRLNIDMRVLFNFLDAVQAGYRSDIPFHTATHGADVAQSLAFFIEQVGLAGHLAPHELMAVLVAGLVHDYAHPGVNNNFLVKTQSGLALRYNDISVLENYHIAEAMMVLSRPECDVFASLASAERREVRALMIELVLATDLKNHFEIIADFKRYVVAKDLQHAKEKARQHDLARLQEPVKPAKGEDGRTRSSLLMRRNTLSLGQLQGIVVGEPMSRDELAAVLKMAIKCADLGHPAKTWPVHVEWSRRIREENFRQGDRERDLGFEVAAFMDRSNPDSASMAKGQLGFFDFLVRPMWRAYTEHFEELAPCWDQLCDNLERWRQLAVSGQSPGSSGYGGRPSSSVLSFPNRRMTTHNSRLKQRRGSHSKGSARPGSNEESPAAWVRSTSF